MAEETKTNNEVATASDPVPVVTTPDPKSMLMGWLVGRRIAKQRGKV